VRRLLRKTAHRGNQRGRSSIAPDDAGSGSKGRPAHTFSCADAQRLPLGEELVRLAAASVPRLALAYRLTSYGAAYLELAMRRTLPLAPWPMTCGAPARRRG
jgi:hypothetical protein